MGLVLFTAHERQKEHQRQLREQMNDVTKRLGELSERLVGQLEEKSELTASEFEIRARLQTEVAHHKRTQGELAETVARSDELDNVLAGERRARNAYQAEQNRKLAERFAVEEQRYKEIRDFLDVHQRLVRGLQKQVTAVQEDATTLRMTTAALETNQNGLIGKVSAARELSNLSSQKIDAIARSQAALYDDLTRTMSQVDSLYYWKKK
jgi:chromosome segregation ATPase